MGDVLKFEQKKGLPVNVISWNDEGKMTINGQVYDVSSTGSFIALDLEENPTG